MPNTKIMLWSLLVLILTPGCFALGFTQTFEEPPAFNIPDEADEEVVIIETSTPIPTEVPTVVPPTEVAEVVPPPDFTLEVVLAPHQDVGTLDEGDLQAAAEVLVARLSAADIDFALQTDDDTEEFTLLTTVDSEIITPLVTRVGFLELVDFSGLDDIPAEGACILTTAQQTVYPDQQLCLSLTPLTTSDGNPFATVITGDGLVSVEAAPAVGQVGSWQILVELNDDASETLGDFTADHIGQPLAIVLDGEVIAAPIVQSRIEGQFAIAGNYSAQEAQDLARILSANPLPFSMQIVDVDTLP